jgi:hypothetical protein
MHDERGSRRIAGWFDEKISNNMQFFLHIWEHYRHSPYILSSLHHYIKAFKAVHGEQGRGAYNWAVANGSSNNFQFFEIKVTLAY